MGQPVAFHQARRSLLIAAVVHVEFAELFEIDASGVLFAMSTKQFQRPKIKFLGLGEVLFCRINICHLREPSPHPYDVAGLFLQLAGLLRKVEGLVKESQLDVNFRRQPVANGEVRTSLQLFFNIYGLVNKCFSLFIMLGHDIACGQVVVVGAQSLQVLVLLVDANALLHGLDGRLQVSKPLVAIGHFHVAVGHGHRVFLLL